MQTITHIEIMGTRAKAEKRARELKKCGIAAVVERQFGDWVVTYPGRSDE